MDLLIYDACKTFATQFAALRTRAVNEATYNPPHISGEAALAPAKHIRAQKERLQWALNEAQYHGKTVYLKDHEKCVAVRFRDGKWLGQKEPNAAFGNIPNPNPDTIFPGANSSELETSNRAIVEAQFASNLKEALANGAVLFSSQDFNDRFAIDFQRPVASLTAGAKPTQLPIPNVPLYDMGWSQIRVQCNVPPVLLPGSADPNQNWPVAFIRSCSVDWVKEPRLRIFLNNMVRFASSATVWVKAAGSRLNWRDLINYVPFFGGMDVYQIQWRRYEWISPNIMPLQRPATTDPTYQANMETWYKLCDTNNHYFQHLRTQTRLTADMQYTYNWEYKFTGPSDPTDNTTSDAVFTGITNYLAKDTDIPWMKMTVFQPTGSVSQYQNPMEHPYGDTPAGGEFAPFYTQVNPEVEYTQAYVEEIPAKGTDFSRGGKLGIPSVFMPNAIKSKTELQTLMENKDRSLQTQEFYYYCVLVPSIPYACGAFLSPGNPSTNQTEVTTLPYHIMLDIGCEMRMNVDGNYIQFDNQAWNKLYSNLYSPAMIAAAPRITLSGSAAPAMQYAAAFNGKPYAAGWYPHFFQGGDDPEVDSVHEPTGLTDSQLRELEQSVLPMGEEEADGPLEDFIKSRTPMLSSTGPKAYQSSFHEMVPLSLGGHQPFRIATGDPIDGRLGNILQNLCKRQDAEMPDQITVNMTPFNRHMSSHLQYRRF